MLNNKLQKNIFKLTNIILKNEFEPVLIILNSNNEEIKYLIKLIKKNKIKCFLLGDSFVIEKKDILNVSEYAKTKYPKSSIIIVQCVSINIAEYGKVEIKSYPYIWQNEQKLCVGDCLINIASKLKSSLYSAILLHQYKNIIKLDLCKLVVKIVKIANKNAKIIKSVSKIKVWA